MNIKIALIEDQKDTREMLINLINGYKGYSCVAAYKNAEEASEHIVSVMPDVILVDIHLPGQSGIKFIENMKSSLINSQFIICSSLEDNANIFNALKAGATGYLSKSSAASKIIEAISDVYQGGSPMSSQIARKVLGFFHNKLETIDIVQSEKLTLRENEIIDYLSKGYRYKEIAEKLFISIETVRKHINNIYRKLQVNSSIEAINKVKGMLGGF